MLAKQFVVLFALASAILMNHAQRASAATLIDNGTVVAKVVTPAQPTGVESRAALLLCEYFDKMAGAAPGSTSPESESQLQAKPGQTVLLVGRAETSPTIAHLVARGLLTLSEISPGGDGIVIKTAADDGVNYLVIGGSSNRAVFYAAAHFLEVVGRVGMFWDGEYVPHRADWSIHIVDIAERPTFPVRQYMQGCAWGYSYVDFWDLPQSKQHMDWAAWKKQTRLLWPQLAEDHPENRPGMLVGFAYDARSKAIAYGRESLGLEFITPWYTDKLPLNPDHLYNLDFPCEATVRDLTDEAKQTAFIKHVEAALRRVAEADPQGTWFSSGWGFVDPGMDPDIARNVFAAIGDRAFCISDTWGETEPRYQKHDYFYGHDWLFGVLHSFGGYTTLFGDVPRLVRDMQTLAIDPKAEHLVGTYINPEILFYNTFYFELATALAWRPEALTLEGFTNDYCQKRYGSASAQAMAEVYEELLASVYGNDMPTVPWWSLRLTAGFPKFHWPDFSCFDSERYLPHLFKAVEIARAEQENQANNELYAHDLTEITLQLVRDMFNTYTVRMHAAFAMRDKERLMQAAQGMRLCMDAAEKLMAARKEYWISTILDPMRQYPLEPAEFAKIERSVKHYHTLSDYPWLLDYPRQERLELFQGYYRPRTEVFLRYIESQLDRGEFRVKDEELVERYDAIEKGWLQGPLAADAATPMLSYVEAVDQALQSMRELGRSVDLGMTEQIEALQDGIELSASSEQADWPELEMVLVVKGRADEAVNAEVSWYIDDGSGWDIWPRNAILTAAAGAEGEQIFHARFTGDADDVLPLPLCDVAYESQAIRRSAKRMALPLAVASLAQRRGIAWAPTAPSIDGKLDDPQWQRGADVDAMVNSMQQRKPTVNTEYWLAYDEDCLYVAARCVEPRVDQLRTNVTGHDRNAWDDDSIELFVDSNYDRKTYYQLIITAAGATYDGRGWDKEWNGQWQQATGRDGEAWTVELALPWKTLSAAAPQPGSVMGVLLGRSRVLAEGVLKEKEILQWPATNGHNHHPEMFGTVVFKKQ